MMPTRPGSPQHWANLGAWLRVSGDPDGVPFQPHADMLRQVERMTLITEHGPLDLCFIPDGFPDGYASLSASTLLSRRSPPSIFRWLPSRCRRIQAGGSPTEGHRCAPISRSSPPTPVTDRRVRAESAESPREDP